MPDPWFCQAFSFLYREVCFFKIQETLYKLSSCSMKYASKLCPTLCDPMDCSPPGPRQEYGRIAISSCRRSPRPRDWTRASCVSRTGMRILYHWATREALIRNTRVWKCKCSQEPAWQMQMGKTGWVQLIGVVNSVTDWGTCASKGAPPLSPEF